MNLSPPAAGSRVLVIEAMQGRPKAAPAFVFRLLGSVFEAYTDEQYGKLDFKIAVNYSLSLEGITWKRGWEDGGWEDDDGSLLAAYLLYKSEQP